VLLSGESGTGKEVVARFVHRGSSRKDGPFVALNCAALPEQLLESELFGHEKGAFTGALNARPGKIEQAAGGVLFLDEVGEMSPAVQAKFLRVLQEREYQRLGGTRTLKADMRVLAATNRDLKDAIAKGDFREDLYYRLAVFDIALPPLRERPEDILLLVEAFLEELGRSVGRPAAGVSNEARERLVAYPWPGNVRELRNAIERAVILCEGGLIASEHLPLGIVAAPKPEAAVTPVSPAQGAATLDAAEREMIVQALARAGNNKSKAARFLGLTRAQLRSRIEKHGLTIES
jgi:transcriptional regulator with GAF, ATPase, and Fis domain